MTLSLTINETLKWLSSLPTLMQKSFWWWQCSDRYIISPSPPPPYLLPPISPSLRSLVVSVDVKHHVYLLAYWPLTLLSSLQSYMYTCTSKARSALLSWLRAQSLAAPCLLVLYLWAALVWVSCTSSSEVLALSCVFFPLLFSPSSSPDQLPALII